MPPFTDRRKYLAPDASSRRLRLLIAEDDPDFAAYLSTITRRLDLETVVARDGGEAIELFGITEFDFLICDFEMPKRNGLEVVVELRGNALTTNVYAVMLTMHEDVSLKVNALAVGFDDFLGKNCSEIEVVAKLTAARRMIMRQQRLDLSARQWESIASRDELTGIWSRRFFFESAARHLAEGHTIAVILFDLDDFKRLNDQYGHIMGDIILRDVGGLLLHSTRHDDIVSRYGGDELVVMIGGMPAEESRLLAKRIAQRIEDLRWQVPGESISIGVSYGLGFSELLEAPTVEQLIDAADRDLYAHKFLRKHPDRTAEQLYLYGNPGREAKVEVLPTDARSVTPGAPPVQGAVPLDPCD